MNRKVFGTCVLLLKLFILHLIFHRRILVLVTVCRTVIQFLKYATSLLLTFDNGDLDV